MPPFHVDELAAQALAGESSRGTGIRSFMPDQHRQFFALLPYIFVGAGDEDGWPLASVFAGTPGFVRSPDPTTLHIGARPIAGDPIGSALQEGADIGLLGLDFSNRRRNRANGRIVAVDDHDLTVAVAQSFGNCAQYIQTRRPVARSFEPGAVETLSGLDDDAKRIIAEADTFFVASRSRPGLVESGGFDISHRGGRPGFVRIDGGTLDIPDFRGNRFFNTLGNLLGDPRAGLLFVDFATGDLLQLQGRASIEWAARIAVPAGARRNWRCHIERGWRRRRAFPFTWQFGEFALTTLATGLWPAAA
ncbi:MAG TPA: pyridoxamine 5'-phosphate oxidase family protein [Reyranella sp.]|jgi:predicted pyridoxine 5'-phosphate oxidase superfamily flavin-nucleotide-binding protein|nr:pyridoxamine 5'-phosphate oxidase family protein [Reyranella sp.]